MRKNLKRASLSPSWTRVIVRFYSETGVRRMRRLNFGNPACCFIYPAVTVKGSNVLELRGETTKKCVSGNFNKIVFLHIKQ